MTVECLGGPCGGVEGGARCGGRALISAHSAKLQAGNMVCANLGLIQVTEEGWTGFSKGWQGYSEGLPEGEAGGKSRGAALPAGENSMLYYRIIVL